MILKILIFLAYLVVIGIWEWMGFYCWLASFHPGGDVSISPDIRYRALVGEMMLRPFTWAENWLGHLSLMILPFLYAAFCTCVTLWWVRNASQGTALKK